jgi:hypothetical protein
MFFSPFSNHLGRERICEFIQHSSGTVDLPGDEDESVRQRQSPQSGHGSDYNAASPSPKGQSQNFTKRNYALLRRRAGRFRSGEERRAREIEFERGGEARRIR